MPTSTPQGLRLVHRLIWALIAVFVSSVIGSVGSIVFTIYESRQICGLLNIIDAPDNPPPTNARQQRIADEMHRYRERIGCEQ